MVLGGPFQNFSFRFHFRPFSTNVWSTPCNKISIITKFLNFLWTCDMEPGYNFLYSFMFMRIIQEDSLWVVSEVSHVDPFVSTPRHCLYLTFWTLYHTWHLRGLRNKHGRRPNVTVLDTFLRTENFLRDLCQQSSEKLLLQSQVCQILSTFGNHFFQWDS